MGIWISLNGRADFLISSMSVFFFNPHKQGFLPLENRKRGLEKAVKHLGNVKVVSSHDELVVDVAKDWGLLA